MRERRLSTCIRVHWTQNWLNACLNVHQTYVMLYEHFLVYSHYNALAYRTKYFGGSQSDLCDEVRVTGAMKCFNLCYNSSCIWSPHLAKSEIGLELKEKLFVEIIHSQLSDMDISALGVLLYQRNSASFYYKLCNEPRQCCHCGVHTRLQNIDFVQSSHVL